MNFDIHFKCCSRFCLMFKLNCKKFKVDDMTLLKENPMNIPNVPPTDPIIPIPS